MRFLSLLGLFVHSITLPITAQENLKPDSVFIRIEVSESQPYVNEHVTLKYKLYFNNPESIKRTKPIGGKPNYHSSRGRNIPLPDKRIIKEEYIDGHQYKTVDIFWAVVFPQEEGYMKLQPFTLDVTLVVPTERFDQNNQRIRSEKTKRISTGEQHIWVRSLPEKGKPVDFTGAVGQFAIDVKVLQSDKNPRAYSAIVEVSGNGNLGFFDIPSLTKHLSPFAIGNSDIRENIVSGIFGKKGSITEWTPLAAKKNDHISIPPLNFSYFNPATEAYEQIHSSEITVEVK